MHKRARIFERAPTADALPPVAEPIAPAHPTGVGISAVRLPRDVVGLFAGVGIGPPFPDALEPDAADKRARIFEKAPTADALPPVADLELRGLRRPVAAFNVVRCLRWCGRWNRPRCPARCGRLTVIEWQIEPPVPSQRRSNWDEPPLDWCSARLVCRRSNLAVIASPRDRRRVLRSARLHRVC
jgi:hypothetical protein